MIQTEAGLKQTIEQLNRVLEDQRRRMGDSNAVQFQLFAEGPIDEIRKLRREIDEYLGIQEPVAAGDVSNSSGSAS